MCVVVAFFPGRRRLTNGMLDDLRAAGFYAGKGFALGWKPKKDFDGFATETAAIRQMVALRFSRTRERAGRVTVVVWLTGHEKADPDAWMLLGKAAVDGLVDAGAIRRDRSNVDLAGRVPSCKADLRWLARRMDYPLAMADLQTEGFWVAMVDEDCDCGVRAELEGWS